MSARIRPYGSRGSIPIRGWAAISAAAILVRDASGCASATTQKSCSLRQGLERDRGMLQTGTHRRHFAAREQEKVDRVLDLEDVEIDQKIGVAAAQVRHRQRRHRVADARRRSKLELRAVAPLQRPDRELKVFEVAVKLVDLGEDRRRLGRRNETPSAPREELRAERVLGVFHQPAEPRRGDVEEPRRSGDRSRQHDRADDFDLAQGQHGELSWPGGRSWVVSRPNMMLRWAQILVFDGPPRRLQDQRRRNRHLPFGRKRR